MLFQQSVWGLLSVSCNYICQTCWSSTESLTIFVACSFWYVPYRVVVSNSWTNWGFATSTALQAIACYSSTRPLWADLRSIMVIIIESIKSTSSAAVSLSNCLYSVNNALQRPTCKCREGGATWELAPFAFQYSKSKLSTQLGVCKLNTYRRAR